jgi:signal transduction histidine kinase
MIRQVSGYERESANRRLIRAARDIAATADHEILSTIRVLEIMAQSENLARGDLQAFHSELSKLGSTQKSWLTTILALPDGSQVFNSGRPWGSKLPRVVEMDSLNQSVRTLRPTVGNVAKGSFRGLFAFPIRFPIIRDGKLDYLLTAVISSRAIADLLILRPGPDEWTRTIMDSKGLIVARSRNNDEFAGTNASASFMEKIKDVREGIVEDVSVEGKEVLIAYSTAPFSGWTAAIAVPLTVIQRQMHEAIFVSLGWALGLLALCVSAALLLSRRIARGMHSIWVAASELSQGKRPTIRETGVREIDQVGMTLEKSADILAERQRSQDEALAREEAARIRAEDMSRSKDRFLAMLSHELRNPLNVISIGAHLLQSEEPGSDDATMAREMIERQVAHLSRILDDLLDASRAMQGKITLERTTLDLGRLVTQLHRDFLSRFREKSVAFECRTPVSPVLVDGDETRLTQCVGNLLHNALKFTPEGGKVDIFLETEEDQALLIVADTGPGIDAEVMSQLFEPFTQGRRTLDNNFGGLGLGLAVVKRMVLLHGGTIEVRPRAPGQGTVFTLALPLLKNS